MGLASILGISGENEQVSKLLSPLGIGSQQFRQLSFDLKDLVIVLSHNQRWKFFGVQHFNSRVEQSTSPLSLPSITLEIEADGSKIDIVAFGLLGFGIDGGSFSPH